MRFLRAAYKLWTSSAKFRVGLSIMGILVVLGAGQSILVPIIGDGEDPLEIAAYKQWLPPSSDHLLGTDRYGRDVLAMTLVALVASLKVGAVAGVLSTIVGVIVAFVAGYKGGLLDAILATITEMFLVVPSFPLLLTLSAYVRAVNLAHVALMLTVFSWPFAARTSRAQVLSLRSRPYVDLARVSNLSDLEIIFQELLPNVLPYIGLGFANAALGAIFALMGLEVIGLGPSETLSLGIMLNWAIGWGALSLGAWPMLVAPAVPLVLLFTGMTLINISLEETYNPRLREVARIEAPRGNGDGELH